MSFQTSSSAIVEAPPGANAEADAPVMALSVVIATHNRLDFLTKCLAALAPQAARADVEVIVVDSCSDPKVSRKVRDAARGYGFKFIGLKEPGVSKARNAGAAMAAAPWFATLDDDAIPEAGWVEGAIEAIEHAAPQTGVIQGRVEPLWLGGRSVPVEPLHARFLSIVTYDKDKEYGEKAHCAGANMLVNRSFHIQIGGYGETFGRVRDKLVSGIDTDLVDRMREVGARIFYTNAFSVRHAVSDQRLTRDWVRERSLHDGRAVGEIIFTRRSAPVRLAAVIKSLGGVVVLGAASALARQSYDLLIRRSVNLGILEHAPLVGSFTRRFNATRALPTASS